MGRRLAIGIGVIIMMYITSCKKENEENLINKQGGPAPCDTVNMKYKTNILDGILKTNCFSCHGNGQDQGVGVNFDTYANTKKQVDNGDLLKAITHAPGVTPMPFNLPMLSSCDINKITDWINNGAPDN